MSLSAKVQPANEALAARIVDALQQAGLVSAELAGELRQKLAAGTAREADWRAWIRIAPPAPPEDPFGGPTTGRDAGGHRVAPAVSPEDPFG